MAARLAAWVSQIGIHAEHTTSRPNPGLREVSPGQGCRSRRATRKGSRYKVITVTEEAKEILGGYDCPEGTVLRLDSVDGHNQHDGFHVRIGAGRIQVDDQIVEHEGKTLLCIARRVSEENNGGTVDLVETLEGPAVGMKPPPPLGAPQLTDGS